MGFLGSFLLNRVIHIVVEDTGLYFEAWNGLSEALAKLFGEILVMESCAGF